MAVGLLGVPRAALIVALGGGDVVREGVLELFGAVFHYCPIGFVHFSLTKQFVHTREAFACLGKHHKAAHRAVDAMSHSAEHVTGLVVLFLYPLLECFHKRLVAGLVALHYLAHGFVDYYYMIVFVYYFHL